MTHIACRLLPVGRQQPGRESCTVPGLEVLRWRTTDEQPPAAVRITSPYDLDARYCSKRDTHWVGYKLHLTETCEPERPDLVTQVLQMLKPYPPNTMESWRVGDEAKNPRNDYPEIIQPIKNTSKS